MLLPFVDASGAMTRRDDREDVSSSDLRGRRPAATERAISAKKSRERPELARDPMREAEMLLRPRIERNRVPLA